MDAHMMMHKCTGTCASSYIDRHDVIFTFVIVMNDGSEVEMAQRQRIANKDDFKPSKAVDLECCHV